MNKLRITYNNDMRRLFNLHFRCSASEMFANCNIHSMDEMRRTCIYSFILALRLELEIAGIRGLIDL